MIGTLVAVRVPDDNNPIEGYVSGTPKPGTAMQLKSSVAPKGGRYTYEVFSGGDGERFDLYILGIDYTRGRTYNDAYADGDRCFLHNPRDGEEYNVRKKAITGTGSPIEDLNVGEFLIVEGGTGLFKSQAEGPAVPAWKPFRSLETLVDQTAEQGVCAVYKPTA